MTYCENPNDIVIKRGTAYDATLSVSDTDGNPYELKENEKLIFTVKKVKDLDAEPILQRVWNKDDCADDGTFNLHISDDETTISTGRYFYEFSRMYGDEHYPTGVAGGFVIVDTAAQRVD